ncbi:MAG: nicotinamide-nucleotide amidohydrolase family protein [Sinobacteraceae bacterium]|nr:nicotinamide-nucleotide amidohydrolase family protein [Nevskiaceae bacterium]
MSSEFVSAVERVARWALARGHRLATAESCTGGWIAKVCTDLPGSSRWFECGFVTYSNAAKIRDLGVAARTLEEHGAVSEATVREMAAGALRTAGVDLAIAVSGIAGPDGGSDEKPVGTVWFCAARRLGALPAELVTDGQLFGGDRDTIRRLSVQRALQLLLRWVDA